MSEEGKGKEVEAEDEAVVKEKREEQEGRKVAVVTGATSGIGFETAQALYLPGYHVVLGAEPHLVTLLGGRLFISKFCFILIF